MGRDSSLTAAMKIPERKRVVLSAEDVPRVRLYPPRPLPEAELPPAHGRHRPLPEKTISVYDMRDDLPPRRRVAPWLYITATAVLLPLLFATAAELTSSRHNGATKLSPQMPVVPIPRAMSRKPNGVPRLARRAA